MADEKLILKDEVFQIVGCAFEVLNTLGYGLLEKPYENAMVVEMGLRNIPFIQQKRLPVIYKEIKVGEYIPDLKTIDKITNHDRGQMLNYLKITKLRVGLIVNFKHQNLEWERIVL